MSGRSKKRPEFNRLIEQAIDPRRPVQFVLTFAIARMARDMRLFFDANDTLADAGVTLVSITENFGEGRSKRIGQTITAMIAEQQAIDASVYTRKSRRENARQGFYNGGPVPFGYETYVAQRDGQKERMKLRVVPNEAAVVREVFDWAEAGRGGRWIVKTLNDRGTTLRGAKFSNSNLAGILGRAHYSGIYHDKTADDEGFAPEPEDWIAVECPAIVAREQHDRVAAIRANRNPRKTAPHISAGTTLLSGVARCGMPGCDCGLTVRSGKAGQYHYYVCNGRVNKGRSCAGPSIRREQLDGLVVNAVERCVLEPSRLAKLLHGVINLSDQKRQQFEQELAQARSEQTRFRTAIDRLLILVETGEIGPRDPQFAKRLSENREGVAAAGARIVMLERQLERGARQITERTIARFGALLSSKLHDDDAALRTAYVRMMVISVTVSSDEIVITGPTSVLERGVINGLPRLEGAVPIFDREWCRLQDSNL